MGMFGFESGGMVYVFALFIGMVFVVGKFIDEMSWWWDFCVVRNDFSTTLALGNLGFGHW